MLTKILLFVQNDGAGRSVAGGLFFSDLSSALSVSSFLGKEPALRSTLWGH